MPENLERVNQWIKALLLGKEGSLAKTPMDI